MAGLSNLLSTTGYSSVSSVTTEAVNDSGAIVGSATLVASGLTIIRSHPDYSLRAIYSDLSAGDGP